MKQTISKLIMYSFEFSMGKNIIIIGSGFAGLSAACFLAKAGHQVTIIEKNDQTGGRARTWEKDGFVFDMGPSWYWMPDVFENFFAHFGKKVSDYYHLIRLDPGYRIFFGKNDTLDVPADLSKLKQTFESIEKGSGKQLDAFLAQAEYKYKTGMGDYVFRPSLSITEFFDFKLIAQSFRIQLFSSISKHVRHFFSHPKLIQLLEFPVLFLGATPKNTPALYSMMNYADLSLGTWYPQGGMNQISKAFTSLAIELGVTIKLNEEVVQLKTTSGRVTEVITNKQTYTADSIIANADYAHVEKQLTPAEERNYSDKYWNSRALSPSSLLFYIGLNKPIDGLLHHNLFFDENFDAHAKEIYGEPKWPSKPLFYASCTSKTDPEAAPNGSENLFLLIPLAPGLADSEEMREKYYHILMDRLEKLTEQSIKEHVVVKRSYAMNDFVSDYHSFKGNAYGLANTLLQTAFLKPSLRSKKIKNLFFTGQLTVPGPGVPPAIISGEVVAKEVLKSI